MFVHLYRQQSILTGPTECGYLNITGASGALKYLFSFFSFYFFCTMGQVRGMIFLQLITSDAMLFSCTLK